jgi:TPR repeat protein
MREILFIIALTFGLQAGELEKIKNACDADNAEECTNLGILYQTGKNLDKNYEKAKIYYAKACDLNHFKGCRLLGDLYYFSQGVEQNITKAKLYYDKSCKLNNQNGCSKLKSLVEEENALKQIKDEQERLKQELMQLIQEAEVLDDI